MALLALPILFFLLLLTAVLLLFKRWKLAAITFTALLLHNWYWQVFPLNLFYSEKPAENTCRVVTYNIYPQVDSTHYDQWQRDMLEEIKRLRPDILCLQEFKNPEMEWLEKELCKYFSYTEDEVTERWLTKWLLYSRFPMSQITRYKPVCEFDTTGVDTAFNKALCNHYRRMPFYSANIHLPSGDSVTVFSCHLQSSGYSSIRRKMKESESWFDGIGRYSNAYRTAERLRLWEARSFRQVLDSIGNDRAIIIAGDFNDFNQSECLRTIQGNTIVDAWWENGCGLGLTYTGFGMKLRLDHILYNNKVKNEHIEVGKSELSDHHPLICDFSIVNDK